MQKHILCRPSLIIEKRIVHLWWAKDIVRSSKPNHAALNKKAKNDPIGQSLVCGYFRIELVTIALVLVLAGG